MEPTHDEESTGPRTLTEAEANADGWSFTNRPVEPDRAVGTPIYDQLVQESAQRALAPAPSAARSNTDEGDPLVGAP